MLREVLASLTPEERERLMLAFNNRQFACVTKGKYVIGVHPDKKLDVVVVEQAGHWFLADAE